MKLFQIITIMFLVAGCSSKLKANPCATPGGTYNIRYVELYGDCGALPSVKSKINEDGTINGDLKCKSMEQNGCTARNSGCKISASNCVVDTNVTFSGDGSSATGLVVLSCPDICTSSYSVYFTEID